MDFLNVLFLRYLPPKLSSWIPAKLVQLDRVVLAAIRVTTQHHGGGLRPIQ